MLTEDRAKALSMAMSTSLVGTGLQQFTETWKAETLNILGDAQGVSESELREILAKLEAAFLGSLGVNNSRV